MTQEEHAQKIKDAIAAAEADGFDVFIDNNCCGCGAMSLEINPATVPGTEGATLILGERK